MKIIEFSLEMQRIQKGGRTIFTNYIMKIQLEADDKMIHLYLEIFYIVVNVNTALKNENKKVGRT